MIKGRVLIIKWSPLWQEPGVRKSRDSNVLRLYKEHSIVMHYMIGRL